MAYSDTDLERSRVWRHARTGNLYHVIGVSVCATNGAAEGQVCVVYFSVSEQILYHRNIREFLDGRFIPVSPA